MQETQVQFLGWEDPLEKEMAPLQYSFLENPMDGGAWQAADHRVANRWTQLRDFSFTFIFQGRGIKDLCHKFTYKHI